MVLYSWYFEMACKAISIVILLYRPHSPALRRYAIATLASSLLLIPLRYSDSYRYGWYADSAISDVLLVLMAVEVEHWLSRRTARATASYLGIAGVSTIALGLGMQLWPAHPALNFLTAAGFACAAAVASVVSTSIQRLAGWRRSHAVVLTVFAGIKASVFLAACMSTQRRQLNIADQLGSAACWIAWAIL